MHGLFLVEMIPGFRIDTDQSLMSYAMKSTVASTSRRFHMFPNFHYCMTKLA